MGCAHSTKTSSILVEVVSLFSFSPTTPHFPLRSGQQLVQCLSKGKERKEINIFTFGKKNTVKYEKNLLKYRRSETENVKQICLIITN